MSKSTATDARMPPNNPTPAATAPPQIPQADSPGTVLFTHPWMFKEDLPKLQDDNLLMWQSSLQSMLIEKQLEHIATSHFTPTNADETKATPCCQRMIFRSLSDTVRKRIPSHICTTSSTYDIIQGITAVIPVQHKPNPHLLVQKSQSIRLKDNLQDFFDEHAKVRDEQIAANVPGVHDEMFTVYHMLQGLSFFLRPITQTYKPSIEY